MTEKRKISWIIFTLVVMMMVQLLVMIYWAQQKKGIFMDEISTYLQSNGDGYRRIYLEKDFYNNWQPASKWLEHIVVSEDTQFDYRNVIQESLSNKAHPPLYFLLMHTVMSLTPGYMSYWQGIIVNLIFFAGSIILLFKISKILLNNEWMALLPCFVFGFSAAAVNGIIMIRMYFMMTFFCLWFLHSFLKLIRKGSSFKGFVGIFLSTFFGVMTQYYFLVFAFFPSFLYCIYMLYKKSWKNLFFFIISMVSSLILCVFVYPSIIGDLFSGTRGAEAIESALSGIGFQENLIQYLKIISSILFNTYMKEFLVLLIILSILTFAISTLVVSVKHKRNFLSVLSERIKFDDVEKNIFIVWTFLAILCIAYIVIIARIAPMRQWRYIFCITPILVLEIIILIKWICAYWKINLLACAIVICVLSGYCFTSSLPKQLKHLYKSDEKYEQICSEYDGYPVVYIVEKGGEYRLVNHHMQMLKLPNSHIYVSRDINIEKLSDSNVALYCGNGILLYIPNAIDQKSMLETVMQITGQTQSNQLFKHSTHTTYYLSNF